jgi:hypothetical protein
LKKNSKNWRSFTVKDLTNGVYGDVHTYEVNKNGDVRIILPNTYGYHYGQISPGGDGKYYFTVGFHNGTYLYKTFTPQEIVKKVFDIAG